jgi:phosphate starvation-inducible membrane PsiE
MHTHVWMQLIEARKNIISSDWSYRQVWATFLKRLPGPELRPERAVCVLYPWAHVSSPLEELCSSPLRRCLVILFNQIHLNLSCLLCSLSYFVTGMILLWRWEMKGVAVVRCLLNWFYIEFWVLIALLRLFSKGFHFTLMSVNLYGSCTCEWAARCGDRYVALLGQSWHQLSECLKTVVPGAVCCALALLLYHLLERSESASQASGRSKLPCDLASTASHRWKMPKLRQPLLVLRIPFSELRHSLCPTD